MLCKGIYLDKFYLSIARDDVKEFGGGLELPAEGGHALLPLPRVPAHRRLAARLIDQGEAAVAVQAVPGVLKSGF